jgi:hypothetical protein
MNDTEKLRILSVFHYVVGLLTLLFALLPSIHLMMGIMMITGRFAHEPDFPARPMGWFFTVLALLFMLAALALGIALIMAGRNLAARTRYTFCFVVAGLSTLLFPFGTVLGVFTILTLAKDSVRSMFAGSA